MTTVPASRYVCDWEITTTPTGGPAGEVILKVKTGEFVGACTVRADLGIEARTSAIEKLINELFPSLYDFEAKCHKALDRAANL